MKKYFLNFSAIITTLVLIFQPYFILISTEAKAAGDAGEESNILQITESSETTSEDGLQDLDAVDKNPDAIALAAAKLVAVSFDKSNTLSTDVSSQSSISKISNLTKTSKLVFNPSDLQDLRVLNCMGNAIPDYEHNDDSLASASGKTLTEISDLKSKDPNTYTKLLDDAKEAARKKITDNLKTGVTNFACIAGLDETAAAEMLKTDKEATEAIIKYAQEKVVIDRRILELLVNLVTPKDQGGGGHERIKVYRIRRNYTRDSVQTSRESESIYADLETKAKEKIQTVADVKDADRDDLAKNQEFASAEVVAEVSDAAGRSQGELIIGDSEDVKNISAHYKGQAIDISEVDNIKCTLIKKKRVGKDKKIAKPPTPIKLQWQTTEGYDASPPQDYTSLQMNLKQIAGGQYLDLLSELGIDSDFGSDLSGSSFNELIGLIGESLLSEVLMSPSGSYSFSFPDTLKRVGGMILADKLGLPRGPFLDSDLSDLDDLLTNIGEGALEQKLNLPYGSIKGNNMAEILTNLGLRTIEKELDIPDQVLKPGISAAEMKLETGKKTIEEELGLPPGTIKADTTYAKLKEGVGGRKAKLVFAVPSEIDATLNLDINEQYSQKYKDGSLSPDTYATLVGGKVLADSGYLFDHASSSGNALRTSITNDASETATSTAKSKERFNSIMSGTLSVGTSAGSFDEMYKQIGAEFLAQALSTNNDTRAALNQWLLSNAQPTQTTCAIPKSIEATITKPGKTDMENVVIPEDQIMTTFGLRRGDLSRLFGCYNVAPKSVYKGLGENTLYESVKSAGLAEKVESKFLSSHPEISGLLRDLDFYKSRIEMIKNKSEKIKSEWESVDSTDPGVATIKAAANSVASGVSAIDLKSLEATDLVFALNTVKQLYVDIDQINSRILSSSKSSDSTLRDKANSSISDVNLMVHAADEVISGQEQADLSSLQIKQISTAGNGSSQSATTSSIGLNRATISLLLAGRLLPIDLLISFGADVIEESLNLPTNSLLYFSKYLTSGGKDKDDLKSAFFRAIGQAQVEEGLNAPPFFFQGANPAEKATLSDVVAHIAKEFSLPEAEAGARLLRVLNLSGSVSTITSGKFSSTSAAKSIDEKLGLPIGATLDFLTGKSEEPTLIGNSDKRMFAGILDLPENVISKFLLTKDGKETIDEAKKMNFAGEISYNSHNEFAEKKTEDPSKVGTCPIDFIFDTAKKLFKSDKIEDGSYIYTNSKDTLSFPGLNEARTFAKDDPDKVDFLKALSIKIASDKGSDSVSLEKAGAINTKLTDFINDKKKKAAFSDDDGIESKLINNFDIPKENLKALFERENVGDSRTIPIDYYLEIVGKKTAESRITVALLGDLSTTIGGQRIDAGDIFDLLSGNSTQTLMRIGGRYLEQQLDLPTNIVSGLLEAKSLNLKNCSLAEVGSNILGGIFGLNSLSITEGGNIFDNIGGSKIEEALGLPEKSFRGATLDELIASIGPVKFAGAFQIPPEMVLGTSTWGDLGNSSLSQYSVDEQYTKLNAIFEYPDSVGSTSLEKLTSAESKISNGTKSFVSGTEAWGASTTSSKTIKEYQIAKFQSRCSQIDGQLGIPAGTTQNLLSGKISPDSYRKKAAENVLLASADNILESLGLKEFSDIILRVMNLSQTLNTIKSCASGACDQNYIFSQLTQLLGVNFDAKLGLPTGTITTIIADPQQAAYKLVSSALGRLDDSLGLTNVLGDSLKDASFSSAFAVWYNQNYKNCPADPTGCLYNIQKEDILDGPDEGKNRWQVYLENVGNQMAVDYLGKMGFLPVKPGHLPADEPNTNQLIREAGNLLIHGDLRILQISAAVKAAEALHIYGDSSTVNLPEGYRITFEDIFYAFMGDYEYETATATAAEDNFVSRFKNAGKDSATGSFASADENSELADMSRKYLTGAQCPPGVTASDCLASSDAPSSYSTYDKMDATLASFKTKNPADPSADKAKEIEKIGTDPNASASLESEREYARNKARGDLLQNLMYRMSDAKLYGIYSGIPVGFTETMLKGNGFMKSMMLMTFVENSLRNLKILGTSLEDILTMKKSYESLLSFYENPAAFDLDSFVANGEMAKIDEFLMSKVGDILGFKLESGTFTALAYGLKSGDFTKDFSIIGKDGKEIKISSVKTIYTDWSLGKLTFFADQTLGLPSGTAKTAYTMYNNILSVKNAMLQANLAIGTAKEALASAEAMGLPAKIDLAKGELATAKGKLDVAGQKIVELKAELVSFVINTLFSKQVAAVESSLGLVPGTGAILVSMLASYLMGAAVSPVTIAIFVLLNLFGVYKVKLICSADGYYPGIEVPTDPMVFDNGNLGIFSGMSPSVRKTKFVEAAQYKARVLAGDALKLAERTGDETAVPMQIMTGRNEDADYWQPEVTEFVCSRVGGCDGANVGIWKNPQTTGYTHIGF